MKPKYYPGDPVPVPQEHCSIYQMIISYDWSDYTAAEVAEMLKCSKHNVYHCVSAARKNGIDVELRRAND